MATHLIGTGNIGKRVLEKGQDIKVITKKELNLETKPLNYNFDKESIGGTPLREGDTIIFTAAISEPAIVSAQFLKATTVNVESTGEFIQGAIDLGCNVLFLSSDTVYGDVETGFDESHPINPKGAYAEMKSIVEKRFEGNPNFKSFRCSLNFYKDDRFTQYLKTCAANNVEADIFDPLTRAIVHRDDTVDAILAVANDWSLAEGQYTNCGGPQVLSRAQIAETMKRVSLPNLQFKVSRPPSKFYTDRPAFIEMKSPNLKRILGRSPVTFEEAVKIEFA